MKKRNQKVRILFLEAKNSEIELIQKTLADKPGIFEFTNAKDASEIIKYVNSLKPDIIISDFLTGHYSATEIYEKLRQENLRVPFIIVTESMSDDIAAGLISRGIEDCITRKNIHLLPQSIDKAIQKSRLSIEKSIAENELKYEQEKRDIFFNNAPSGIINIGFKGEILEINPVGLKILQVDSQLKLNKKNIFDFIHPEDLRRFKKFHSSVGIGNKKTDSFRIVGSNKEERWIESNAVPIVDESNHVISILTINRDITEILETKEKFELSEERFRKLTAYAPVGIYLTDEKGDSIYVNERWCEIAGIKGKSALGNGWVKALHPDDRENVFKEWYNCAIEGKEFRMEFRFVKPDGEIKWLTSSAVPMKNNEGIVTGYVGTVTDITDIKKYERSLRESEQRLVEAQEIANIGNWEFNFRDQTGYWSKQMFLIHEKDESKGKPLFDEFLKDIHPDDREKLVSFHNGISQDEVKKHFEYRLLINGKKKYMIAIARGVKDPVTGEFYKIQGTSMDISELKKSQQRASISELKYQDLFDNSPDAIYIEDENGVMVDMNCNACKLQGYSREEMVGKNIIHFVPELFRKTLVEGFHKLLNNEIETLKSFVWDKEWNPIHVEIKSHQITYLDRKAVLLHVRDITREVAIEKANRELELKFETLANEAPVAIYQVDNSGKVIIANKKYLELLDMTWEEVQAGEWIKRIHRDDLPRFYKIREEVEKSKKPIEAHFRLFVKGHIIFIISKSSPLIDENGNSSGRIGTLMELSQDEFDQKLKVVY